MDWAVDPQYYGDRTESPKGLQTSVKDKCGRRQKCGKTTVDTRTVCWESGRGPGSDKRETLTSALNLGMSTGDLWNRHMKEWKELTENTQFASVLMRSLRVLHYPVPMSQVGDGLKTQEERGVQGAVPALRCQLGHFFHVCIHTSALSAGAAQRPQKNRQATH